MLQGRAAPGPLPRIIPWRHSSLHDDRDLIAQALAMQGVATHLVDVLDQRGEDDLQQLDSLGVGHSAPPGWSISAELAQWTKEAAAIAATSFVTSPGYGWPSDRPPAKPAECANLAIYLFLTHCIANAGSLFENVALISSVGVCQPS
jgi:hypothetical protein